LWAEGAQITAFPARRAVAVGGAPDGRALSEQADRRLGAAGRVQTLRGAGVSFIGRRSAAEARRAAGRTGIVGRHTAVGVGGAAGGGAIAGGRAVGQLAMMRIAAEAVIVGGANGSEVSRDTSLLSLRHVTRVAEAGLVLDRAMRAARVAHEDEWLVARLRNRVGDRALDGDRVRRADARVARRILDLAGAARVVFVVNARRRYGEQAGQASQRRPSGNLALDGPGSHPRTPFARV